jgi:hypothetical protein
LGGERIRRKKSSFWSNIDRDLFTLKAFDDELLKAFLKSFVKGTHQ